MSFFSFPVPLLVAFDFLCPFVCPTRRELVKSRALREHVSSGRKEVLALGFADKTALSLVTDRSASTSSASFRGPARLSRSLASSEEASRVCHAGKGGRAKEGRLTSGCSIAVVGILLDRDRWYEGNKSSYFLRRRFCFGKGGGKWTSSSVPVGYGRKGREKTQMITCSPLESLFAARGHVQAQAHVAVRAT